MLRFLSEASGSEAFQRVDIILSTSVSGTSFTIGRALGLDLVIALPTLSREHCKFALNKSGKWQIEDLSSQGTWVNGEKLAKRKPCILNDSDIIKLSEDCLVYEFKSSPCIGEPSSPRKTKDTDKKPLSRLSLGSNIKENATHDGYVPESQLKMLAAEEAEKRKKLEQSLLADLKAQREKYEEELEVVKEKLHLAEQKEILFTRKQEEWKHERDFLTCDVEKRQNQLDEAREVHAEQLEEEKQKLNCEIARWENESLSFKKLSEELDLKLKAKTKELKCLSNQDKKHIKEKELIKEENRLLLEEKQRLETEVKTLTERLEFSSGEAKKLENEKEVLSKEKVDLVQQVDHLHLDLIVAEGLKEAVTENQIHTIEELMENELQCAICTEVVVKSHTLVCGHTFCQVCIEEWMLRNPHCPNCRKKIERSHPSTVLDGFIGKMVDNLSDSFKRKRGQIVNEKEEVVRHKQMRLMNLQAPQAFIDLTLISPHIHNP